MGADQILFLILTNADIQEQLTKALSGTIKSPILQRVAIYRMMAPRQLASEKESLGFLTLQNNWRGRGEESDRGLGLCPLNVGAAVMLV